MADSNEPYVVVGSQYCLPEESVLILKEKMWSLREKAEIRDGQEQLVFRTEEKAWDIKERKTIFNAQDEPVCSMISKVFSLSHTTYLCAGADAEPDNALLTAKSVVLTWSPILNVFLKGNTSDDAPDIILKGNFIHYDFTITTSSGRLLATVDRVLLPAFSPACGGTAQDEAVYSQTSKAFSLLSPLLSPPHSRRAFSWRNRKTIFNAQDEPVCSLTSKALSLHDETYLCPGASVDKRDALLTARSKFFSWTPILNIFLKGNSVDNKPDIVLKGDFFQHEFTITSSSGLLLAQVERDIWSVRDFLSTHTYAVRIKPNVDMALILALVAMADTIFVNKENDDHD
ncbi:unnamed protein product [Closterium sp. Naga37s-1]|nr:unnamed protein product [Closterium sp. Naga37s-1]